MRSQSEVTLVHPDRRHVLAFGQGRLDEAKAAAIEKHLAECATCCELLKQVKDDTLVELARAAAGDTPGALPKPDLGKTDAWGKATQPAKIQLQLAEIPPELRDHPRYRIVERLGEGGMGVVYKAEHRMMERFVALKVISGEFTAHPTAVERFRQEVRAAAKLSHGNIVTAHDAEQAGDLHFLVMEYVEGVSLAKLVQKKGPLPAAQVALFVRQVAQGLHHAHTHGMIHRDIKPHNLMVTRKGQVKILDFGLARFGNRASSNLTKAEMVVGTPDYMAPEQARDSRNVDTRADLYSLGCTMYFLLTGRPPFTADSAISLMFKHCEEEPTPVEDLRDDVPDDMLGIMEKLMAKNPAARYQTPAEAAAALMPFIRPLSQSLDLPQRGAAAAPVDEVPVAELLDGSASPTMEETPRTVPVSKRPGKRRSRGKSARKKASLVRLGVLSLILGVLAALLVWKYWPDLLSGVTSPADSQQVAANDPEPSGPGAPAGNGGQRGRSSGQGGLPPARPPGGQENEEPPPAKSQGGQGDGPSVAVPGGDGGQRNHPPMGEASGRRVLFLLPEDLWYADYGPVREVLERHGFQVETASYAAMCHAADPGGQSVRPDYPLEKVSGADYEAIVFVGRNSGPYANHQHTASAHAVRLLKDMKKADKHIAAICTGQYVLLAHGHMQGKQVARNFQMKQMIPHADSNPLAGFYMSVSILKSVHVDGKLITGSGPEAAKEFGQTLAAELKKGK